MFQNTLPNLLLQCGESVFHVIQIPNCDLHVIQTRRKHTSVF